MFKNWKIGTKLIAVCLAIGLVPLALIGFLSLQRANQECERKAFDQLVAVRDIKRLQIEQYFAERLGDVNVLSSNPTVVAALQAYEAGYELGVNSPEYAAADKTYSRWLTTYEEEYGYYDLFLIAKDGDIVYTVEKEPDFATNVVNGRWASENIGSLFKKACSGVAVEDFASYAPSNGAPASFVGAPVRSESGEFIGVVALQLPLDQIDKVMQERSGMGESGETYLVGADHLLRSNSRFSKEPTVFKLRVETATCQAGLAGQTGYEIVPDYRGIPVLSAYTPVKFGHLAWVLMAEIDEAEAFAVEAQMRKETILIGLVVGLLVAVAAWLFARSLSKPITQIAKVAEAIATGDVQHDITVTSKDEIGILANSFRSLITYMKGLAGAAERIAGNDLTVRVEPQSDKDVLGNSFKTMINNLTGMIRQLGANATELVTAANEIASASEQMSRGAGQQNEQMGQISTAVEEMTATILESSKNAAEASTGAQGASETASHGGLVVNETVQGMQRIASVVRESADSIQKLATSADRIGEIIGVIDDIADQTNLLALNAAIEAARAGEQGRGFAVVADEVRKLAERSSKATGEITDMIKGIQNDTRCAVQSMEAGIGEVDKGRELADRAGNSLTEVVAGSQHVMDMIRQIATATEEQSAAAEQISKSIEHVAAITKETASGAEQSAAAAEELNRQAEGLREMVGKFRVA